MSLLAPKTVLGGHYTEIEVSGERRRILTAYWDQLQGPKPLDLIAFKCNGCTLSPDALGNIPVVGRVIRRIWCAFDTWPACYLHDYHTYPGSEVDRKDADDLLRTNLKTILVLQGCARPLAALVAYSYWKMCRKLGRSRYSGNGDPAE